MGGTCSRRADARAGPSESAELSPSARSASAKLALTQAHAAMTANQAKLFTEVEERLRESVASASEVTRAAYAAMDAAVDEKAQSVPVELLLQQEFGVLRNALGLLLLLADERAAAQGEAGAAEAARELSRMAAREGLYRDALRAGLPEAAATAAADVVSSPGAWLSTIAGGRAAWSALGTWARYHGVSAEGTLRWLLGALELPADAAPSIVALLDEEGQAGSGGEVALAGLSSPSCAAQPSGGVQASRAVDVGTDNTLTSTLEDGQAYHPAQRDAHEFLAMSSEMFHGLLEWCA